MGKTKKRLEKFTENVRGNVVTEQGGISANDSKDITPFPKRFKSTRIQVYQNSSTSGITCARIQVRQDLSVPGFKCARIQMH